MTFTREQLSNAVNRAGIHGKPFSSAAVRHQLGMSTNDKRTLTRFNHELHAYHKANGSQLERLGNNRYRLRHPPVTSIPQHDETESFGPSGVSQIKIRIVRVRASEVDELDPSVRQVERFSVRSMLGALVQPVLRRVFRFD